VDGRAQLRRETGRDRHRTVCDFLPSPAFAGDRHHQPRFGTPILQILYSQPSRLVAPRTGDGQDLDVQRELVALVGRFVDDRSNNGFGQYDVA
jgi:hypothetical protein